MNEETRESGEIPKAEIATPVEDISVDVIFELISHQRRHAILDLLLTYDQSLTITDLRNEIVEKEEDTEITEISSEQVKQVHISLHHVHIPKLEEKGIVNYDSDRSIVEPTEKLSQLEPFLSQL
ncbi:DUF7344 domain-containing protein [Halopiger xanaduensis]|uniref:DUF7344 domain-containing protein n=1 Tax=Halopiger xanaduensis (strain DSM 18323 / JCM 14033 / SH-6) TaxID=797210 RepID=F8DC37_HALXS|nr:hypothetical protein [Halopiger xanaduensis]AEH37150.1 hypothetical protein Halxa_2532 [Halopiger xanaduensis SH-6]